MERTISSRADLDLLWCEFRATGNVAAVLRIIDVLERPDHVRARLEAWLNAGARPGYSLLGGLAKRLLVRKLRKEAGIFVDIDRGVVLSPQDLDCHTVMNGWEVNQQRAVKVAKMIPGGLYGEDDYILMKAAARWSLSSHAHQFLAIRDLCQEEAQKRAGRCRVLLLEIVASTALGRNDLQTAFGALMESLTPDEQAENRERRKAAEDWELLQALSLKSAIPAPNSSSDAREAALKCVRATEAAETYRTRRIQRKSADLAPMGSGDAIWDCQYARPATFRVFQTMWWENDELGDEWIMVPGGEFHGPGYMQHKHKPRRAITQALRASKYMRLIRNHKPAAFGTYLHGDNRYFRFEYRKTAPPTSSFWGRVVFKLVFRRFLTDIELWADAETGYLKKISFGTRPVDQKQPVGSEQLLFSCYNEPVSIVPPAFSLMQPARKT